MNPTLSRRHGVLLIASIAGLSVLVSFQNCAPMGAPATKTSVAKAEGGQGIDGKPFVRYVPDGGYCPDGSQIEARAILVEDHKVIVVRENCVDLNSDDYRIGEVQPAGGDTLNVDGVSFLQSSCGRGKIILSTGSAWKVPVDWCNNNNKVEVFGAGGGGAGRKGTPNAGGGGGGGGYAHVQNVILTPGESVVYRIGSAGSTSEDNGGAGGSTYFCNSRNNCGSYTSSAVIAGAKGGMGGKKNGVAGAGALASEAIGTVVYPGVDGSDSEGGKSGGANELAGTEHSLIGTGGEGSLRTSTKKTGLPGYKGLIIITYGQ
jgi:hypothetical protein